MDAMQSIQSLFSNVRRFTWRFMDNENPSQVSCIAFSVEDARERLLQYLQQIESLQEEAKIVDQQIDTLYKMNSFAAVRSEVDQLRGELEQKLPPIQDNTGCFCTSVFDYSRHMEVHYINGSVWQEMTLQELISTTDPQVYELCLVSFASSLNG